MTDSSLHTWMKTVYCDVLALRVHDALGEFLSVGLDVGEVRAILLLAEYFENAVFQEQDLLADEVFVVVRLCFLLARADMETQNVEHGVQLLCFVQVDVDGLGLRLMSGTRFAAKVAVLPVVALVGCWPGLLRGPLHSWLRSARLMLRILRVRVLRVASRTETRLHRERLVVVMLWILTLHRHLVVGRLWIMSSPGTHMVEVGVFKAGVELRFILPLLRLEIVWVNVLPMVVDFLIKLWALGEEALQVEVFIPAVTH